jgi:hypothetical protein
MTLASLVLVAAVLEMMLTPATSSPITLMLQSGHRDFNYVHIHFYGDTFYKLYSCLTNSLSLTCSADVRKDPKHPIAANEGRVTSLDAPIISRTARVPSNIFTCSFLALQEKLIFSRITESSTDCSNSQQFQLIPNLNNSSLEPKCVQIKFHAANECLSYNTNDDHLEECNAHCNESSPQTEQKTSFTTSPLENTTTEVEVDHHHPGPSVKKGVDLRDKSHIIIAVVVSIAVTGFLVLAGFLFRRNLLSLRKQPNAPYVIGESRPHPDTDSTGVKQDTNDIEFEQIPVSTIC